MRQRIGFLLQLLVLLATPALMGCDLAFRLHFLFLPVGLFIAVVLFYAGHLLRQAP